MSTILKALRRLEEDHDREQSEGSTAALPDDGLNSRRADTSLADARGDEGAAAAAPPAAEPRAAAELRERVLGEETAAEAAGAGHRAQGENLIGLAGPLARYAPSFAMAGVLAIALGILGFVIRDAPRPAPELAEVGSPAAPPTSPRNTLGPIVAESGPTPSPRAAPPAPETLATNPPPTPIALPTPERLPAPAAAPLPAPVPAPAAAPLPAPVPAPAVARLPAPAPAAGRRTERPASPVAAPTARPPAPARPPERSPPTEIPRLNPPLPIVAEVPRRPMPSSLPRRAPPSVALVPDDRPSVSAPAPAPAPAPVAVAESALSGSPSPPIPGSSVPARASSSVETVDRPHLPQLGILSTRWHPRAERRSALLRLEASDETITLREGDAVGPLVIKEITPSSVVFETEGLEIRRRVGDGG